MSSTARSEDPGGAAASATTSARHGPVLAGAPGDEPQRPSAGREPHDARHFTTALLLALAKRPPRRSRPNRFPAAAAAGDGKDPAALALLKRMCDRLQSARTFTVRGRVSLELP